MGRVKYLTSWKAGKLEASCELEAASWKRAGSWEQVVGWELQATGKLQAKCGELGMASWKKARDHKLRVKECCELQAVSCRLQAVRHKLQAVSWKVKYLTSWKF